MKCQKCGWLYGFHDPTCGKEFAQPGFGPTPFQILGPDGKPFQISFEPWMYEPVGYVTSGVGSLAEHWPTGPSWWDSPGVGALAAAYAKADAYATEARGEFMLNVRANDKTLSKIGRAFERALAEAAR